MKEKTRAELKKEIDFLRGEGVESRKTIEFQRKLLDELKNKTYAYESEINYLHQAMSALAQIVTNRSRAHHER